MKPEGRCTIMGAPSWSCCRRVILFVGPAHDDAAHHPAMVAAPSLHLNDGQDRRRSALPHAGGKAAR